MADSSQGGTWWEALARRLKVQGVAGSRATHAALLLGVSAAAAFVVSPGLSLQQIPQIRAEDVGRPFKAPSAAGFKAAQDYDIVNVEVTDRRRREARAAVRPVFDQDPSVHLAVRKEVAETFAAMRERVDEKVAASVPTEPLSQQDFAALKARRFAPELEAAVLALLDVAYQHPVVASREELANAGSKLITLRRLDASQEYTVAIDAPELVDVRAVHALMDGFLERGASLPGSGLAGEGPAVRAAVVRLAKERVRATLFYNADETHRRRTRDALAVKEEVRHIKKGEKILGDGELITPHHLAVIEAMRAKTDQRDRLQLHLGGTGLVALLIAAAYAFHRAAFRRFRPTRKDALLLCALLVSILGMAEIWINIADAVHERYPHVPPEALHYATPIAVGAMLVRFVLAEELALFFALVLAALGGMLLGNSLQFGVYALVTSLVAANQIARAKDRLSIFKAGVVSGLAALLTTVCFSLALGKGLGADALWTAAFAFAGHALLAPMLLMAVTPLIEVSFGYASDIKLLELANLNHPALKELIVQAPGTYHHSIIIGSLVEAAAEAIGANPLLARSCAYYHDIGKGRNPLYFGENQKGENRHDTLAPAMSAVIIKRHVTEGLEMARQYKLPKLVADAIPQHHGTRLVGYFFHKATKEQEGKENPQVVDEAVYRYPGPKPQFREAALVMIADAVEAASRAAPDQSSPKLQALVQKLINVIFSEGQLDECELTLKDLNLIAKSFVHTLEGIYHARPAYPAAAVGGGPRPGEPMRPAPLGVANRDEPKRTAGG